MILVIQIRVLHDKTTMTCCTNNLQRLQFQTSQKQHQTVLTVNTASPVAVKATANLNMEVTLLQQVQMFFIFVLLF